MKVAILVCLALCACAHAGVIAPLVPVPALVRTPAHDSAIIKSDRLGGNFAYSTSEAHAYAQITPVVQNVVAPVAVSYQTHVVPSLAVGYAPAPAVVAHAPIAVGAPVGLPVLAHDQILNTVEVAAPVAPIAAAAPIAPIAAAVPAAPVAAVASDDSDSVAIDSA